MNLVSPTSTPHSLLYSNGLLHDIRWPHYCQNPAGLRVATPVLAPGHTESFKLKGSRGQCQQDSLSDLSPQSSPLEQVINPRGRSSSPKTKDTKKNPPCRPPRLRQFPAHSSLSVPVTLPIGPALSLKASIRYSGLHFGSRDTLSERVYCWPLSLCVSFIFRPGQQPQGWPRKSFSSLKPRVCS